MNYDYEQSDFSKCILAGVFSGLAATVTNLTYNYFYRDHTKYTPSGIVNITTIIFGTMLLFIICSYLYFVLSKAMKSGTMIYTILFAGLTLLGLWAILGGQHEAGSLLATDFKGLIMGMEIISGALLTFFIPFLMKHQSIFI
jgi:hypothetical protein